MWFFVFLLPIPSAYYLFFAKDININIEYKKTDDNRVSVTVLKNKVRYSLFQDIIARILQIPLSLTHYDICFINRSSTIDDAGRKQFIPVNKVTLSGLNNENLGIEPFDIPADGQTCKAADLDQFIINGGTFIFAIYELPSIVKFDINIAPEQTANLSPLDRGISAFVFAVAFYSILILLKTIYSEIKNMFKKFLKKEKQGSDLIKEAENLGVVTVDLMQRREPDYAGLQERVRNAKNTRFLKLMWVIALISAIASVISAIAAWFAVLK